MAVEQSSHETGSFADCDFQYAYRFHDFYLGVLHVMSLAQTLSPNGILSSLFKLLLSDTMVASHATSKSHYLFGAIHSVIVNSVTIVLHVACATLCLSCYNGFRISRDN